MKNSIFLLDKMLGREKIALCVPYHEIIGGVPSLKLDRLLFVFIYDILSSCIWLGRAAWYF